MVVPSAQAVASEASVVAASIDCLTAVSAGASAAVEELATSTPLIMICYKKISLLCCAASGDISVSAFRARMVDSVSAGCRGARYLHSPLKGHRLFLQWPRGIRLGPYRFF